MSSIILKCVKDKSKLRIKFHSYVDETGKHYSDVYNNKYNCRFPRNLRKENTYYKIMIQITILFPDLPKKKLEERRRGLQRGF